MTRSFASAVLAASMALALVGAASAQATDPRWNCSGSALELRLLTFDKIQPLVANKDATRCADDSVGATSLGDALPLGLGMDGVAVRTKIEGARDAPAAQKVSAEVRTARAAIPAASSVLRVEGLESTATGSCVNGQPKLEGSSTVAKLFIGPQEIPVDEPLTTTIQGIDGLTGAVMHVVPKETIREGEGGSQALVYRALHVTLTLGQPVLDAIVGEVRVAAIDDPCAAASRPGNGLDVETPGTPALGQPFGGGQVLGLAELRGVPASHPCRRGKYGRRLAIVGTAGADRVTGSNLADRMWGYAGRDQISGGRGNDCIDGGTGSDLISGSTGSDYLLGAAGADRLFGGQGGDRLVGGKGNDSLSGDSGNDRLSGGPGNDTIAAGFGRDRVDAGPGNDLVNLAVAGKRQFADCGPGRDKVRLNRTDRQRRCEVVLVVG